MPQGSAGYHATGLEGGVWHEFWLRCTIASFVYITHSAVVIQFETALLRPKGPHDGWDESDPPKKWGVMRSRKAMRLCSALFDRMTGRSRPHLSLREG